MTQSGIMVDVLGAGLALEFRQEQPGRDNGRNSAPWALKKQIQRLPVKHLRRKDVRPPFDNIVRGGISALPFECGGVTIPQLCRCRPNCTHFTNKTTPERNCELYGGLLL